MAWERERESFRRQESSGLLFFRVVVMLSCLILVPLAAIFGSAFPEVVKTQLVERIKALAGIEDRAKGNPESVATAETSPSNFGEAPRWNTPDSTPAWQPAVAPAMAHKVDYTTAAPLSEQSRPPAAQAPTQAVDHFTEIQQRLRSYGASHYALEAVGIEGNQYRFTCTMPDKDGRTREFAGADRDPLKAMDKVAREVELWRGDTFISGAEYRR